MSLKTITSVFTLLALLSGCEAMGIKKEKREQLTISCSGNETWGDCDTKAKRMCENGFDVVKKDESLIQQRRIMSLYCK